MPVNRIKKIIESTTQFEQASMRAYLWANTTSPVSLPTTSIAGKKVLQLTSSSVTLLLMMMGSLVTTIFSKSQGFFMVRQQGALGLAKGELDNPKVSEHLNKLAQITRWLEGQPTPMDS